MRGQLLDRILNLLYPPKCPFCRRLLDECRLMCPNCERSLPRIPAGEQCRRLASTEGCWTPVYYEGAVRDSFHRYKFGGLPGYGRAYAALMTDCARENGLDADLVTWVPLSRKRLRKRGYDQARLMAEEVADGLGLPCVCLLRKTRHNASQSGTASPQERFRNVQNVYEPLPGTGGRRILLIDDIVTTGATLTAAAETLLAGGALSVTGLTFARPRWPAEAVRDMQSDNKESAGLNGD